MCIFGFYNNNSSMRIEIDRDNRQMAMLCHLSSLATLVVPGVGSFLGPLLVWLLKRDRSEFIDKHGKESLNFQITVFILGFVFAIMAIFIIGIPLLVALGIYWFVFTIIASVKANNGEEYRYPFCFRILS